MTNLGRTKRRQLLKGAGALSALGALAALASPTAAFAKNTWERDIIWHLYSSSQTDQRGSPLVGG